MSENLYYYPNPLPGLIDTVSEALRSLWDPTLWGGVWQAVLSWYLLIAATVSVITFLLIIIIFRKVSRLSSAYQDDPGVLTAAEDVPIPEVNKRWDHVLELLGSGNPNDWRLAVLEADIMLDELVTRMGYQGEGLGDKLKNIEKADFRTLDDAWEAHKIRNIIAHKGSDYVLTRREAKRVIELFSRVFEEFHYV